MLVAGPLDVLLALYQVGERRVDHVGVRGVRRRARCERYFWPCLDARESRSTTGCGLEIEYVIQRSAWKSS